MDIDAWDRFCDELDKIGDARRINVKSLLESAAKANIALDFAMLLDVYHGLPQQFAYNIGLICPYDIAQFVASYLKAAKVKSILDPWADSLLLIQLPTAVRATHMRGFVYSLANFELATNLQSDQPIQWQQGDFLKTPLAENEQFDAIASCLPMGGPMVTMSFELEGGAITVRDNEGSLALLQSCRNLKPEGAALFVVANGFFRSDNTNSVNAVLSHFGLYIEAAIAVPAGTFKPHTGIPATLVIIRRGSADRMFVGQLSGDRSRDSVLLQNLRSRKRGAEPALGSLVAPSEYRGFEPIATQFRVRELGRALGITPTSLSEITTEINSTTAEVYPGYEEKSNAVYIPLAGVGDVITTLSQATVKQPSKYVQLVLDPDKAVAEYVAKYFNTALGKMSREQIAVGAPFLRLVKDLLPQLQVYLPDRNTQLETIEVHTKIENLISELHELQDRAWAQPRHIREVQRDLKTVNHEERFQDWLDALPFPLASILWTYHAIGEDHQRRYERLLQFFEAQAEFLSAVLIAGFEYDAEWVSRKKHELGSILSGQSLDKGTFGIWVRIAENLAKEARTYLNGGAEAQERCFTLFKTTDRDVLSMLFSSDIISVLQHANVLRNGWAGHTGAVGPNEARERLTVLESLLAKVRRIYGAHWQNYRLVKAGTCAFENGAYRYQVEVIMGTRTPFEPNEVFTDQPMEYKHLYVLPTGGHQPLRLFPLIQVRPSPKTAANACYFYNRVEGNKLRYVSYHFEQDAEMFEESQDTLATLRAIMD